METPDYYGMGYRIIFVQDARTRVKPESPNQIIGTYLWWKEESGDELPPEIFYKLLQEALEDYADG